MVASRCAPRSRSDMLPTVGIFGTIWPSLEIGLSWHLQERGEALAADGGRCDAEPPLLAAVVNTTFMAGENLTVGSTVWLPAESVAPGR